MKIFGENPFSVPCGEFGISPSNEGYTLNYSADGEQFTEWSTATPSGEVLIVTNAPKHMIYKLVGNQSEVYLQY